MSAGNREVILYRLSRARETLEEAQSMLEMNHANAAVNRLYYACFYAVSGLLLVEGKSSSKHSGVRSLFNERWVKPRRVSETLGDLFNRLFDNRQKGDYGDFVDFEITQVHSWLQQATEFVGEISKLLEVSFENPRNERSSQ